MFLSTNTRESQQAKFGRCVGWGFSVPGVEGGRGGGDDDEDMFFCSCNKKALICDYLHVRPVVFNSCYFCNSLFSLEHRESGGCFERRRCFILNECTKGWAEVLLL